MLTLTPKGALLRTAKQTAPLLLPTTSKEASSTLLLLLLLLLLPTKQVADPSSLLRCGPREKTATSAPLLLPRVGKEPAARAVPKQTPAAAPWLLLLLQ